MKVCIAEKPSVAREIANILGAKTRKDGYFEGSGYQVTWTFGHFCSLNNPDDYKEEWKKWQMHSLPMLPEKFETKLKKDKGVKKQFKVVKDLFKKAEVVINCGDAGQEGELIQRWVLKESKYKGPVQRLWISSLTSEAIRDGFQNLKDAAAFDNLFYAGSSRAIGDWLLGMNATRLYTLKYGGYGTVLSIGRVQTPTLAMLVDRYLEIINFKPETYWELQTKYRDVVFSCEKGRFKKIEEGQALLEKVTDKDFVVTSVTKKQGREAPPRLFDLTGLQVHCNKKFSYSAEQTLKLVQELYEAKLVSYPRVDTTYLPNDVYPKVAGILGQLNNYRNLTQVLLGQPIRKSKKVFNDGKVTDHHAIIPTGVERNLTGFQQNVYDAITRRFIAAFYPDCIFSKTTVLGEVEEVKFKATGKEILEPGWRVVYPKPATKNQEEEEGDDKNKKDEERILPEFKKGESGPHEPTLAEKQTKPPPYYTEATLLRAMETAGKQVDDDELRELMKANGIGRPSTRANIIETLFRRKYIKRQKKRILPTEIGVQLIETIQNPLLKSAELTGQWEKKIREIEDGAYSAAKFIHEMKIMVGKLVEEVRMETGRARINAENTGRKSKFSKAKSTPVKRSAKSSKKLSINELVCPKCKKGKLLTGKTAYGCSEWKTGCSFRLPFKFMEKKIPDTQVARLISRGGTIQLKGFKENGNKLTGKLRFNSDFNLVFELKPETTGNFKSKSKKAAQSPKSSAKKDTIPCPKCQSGKVIRGKTAYGCTRWKEGCDFRFDYDEIRKKVNGRSMTKELVKRILEGKV